MIFVDKLTTYPQRPFGHQHWCHLWTDGDLAELHVFAEALGLKRRWFQDKHLLPHYDLVPGKRLLALQKGAHEASLFDWLRERVRP
ncbi:DUF4031 domain-containing protein [Devosia sp.]|uniref:DUF4031 domain-containing protein n=1 Tax=Devosia sp. TaxID=1871048 RepID=UPI0027349ABB|nr:DUF4031 domain-containing protein [Devosia sp.]MDP2779758.1 DUF4031 domain-containing protein [Devosia sp.]